LIACGGRRGEKFSFTFAAMPIAIGRGRKLNGPEVEERLSIPQSQAHLDPDWIGGDGTHVSAIDSPVKQDRELTAPFFTESGKKLSSILRKLTVLLTGM
jgi:hypothetical protein